MTYASLLPIHPHLLSAPHPQKVLVIDDVEMNATLIASVVGTLCDVQIATSSQQGLDMAIQHNPDLILLDILMPGMDGFEVFRRLRNDSRTAHIPVIFLTAVSDASAEEVGLNMGAADFIAKPFRTPALLARVRNHLELAYQRYLLERLSHCDGLTGIANRRYFNTMLSREFSHFISGHCLFIPDDGEPIELRAGDAVLFPANCQGTWDIRETVRKSFVIIP